MVLGRRLYGLCSHHWWKQLFSVRTLEIEAAAMSNKEAIRKIKPRGTSGQLHVLKSGPDRREYQRKKMRELKLRRQLEK